MQSTLDYINNFTLPNGLDIDIDEGWKKIISRQFGGQLGRGFNELIQNLIDSYPYDVPFEKRKGKIITTKKSIAAIDYGEGLNSERIKLLLTLGGTDKANDKSKIGQFGIGFYSIFDPRLKTKKVEVTTLCEGQKVKICFTVVDPEKRPHITAEVLSKKAKYSTKIEIFFDSEDSVDHCLEYARNFLWYYPCKVKIDKDDSGSVWREAEKKDELIFQTNNIHGIFRPNKRSYFGNKVEILCKYEYIMSTSFNSFLRGSNNADNNLNDYRCKQMPYLRDFELVINSNDLMLTISRDGFYINSAFHSMVTDVKNIFIEYLLKKLSKKPDEQLILANQYVFDKKIRDYLNEDDFDNDNLYKLCKMLSEAKVYRINGKLGSFSLSDLYNYKSDDLPLFYTETRENLRWLGGAFKHDFIVLTNTCNEYNNFNEFYDRLFRSVFNDVVNLDTINTNHSKIAELVEREIIDPSSLTPGYQIIESLHLNDKQRAFAQEMEELIGEETIRYIFSDTIKMPVDKIKPAFFAMENENCHVTTGLFTNYGKPIDHRVISNQFEMIETEDSDENYIPKHVGNNRTEIWLGININNPLMQLLIDSNDENRMYYALSYITNELGACQKKLVPHSNFSSWEKKILASKMRKAFIDDLLRKTSRKNRA